jgi:predicted dehydrogenase
MFVFMKKSYNWGILGPGKIAEKFARAMADVPRANLYGIASRNRERAEAFAAAHKAEHIFESYEALVSSPEIDVIYVATPHSHHLEHSLLALQHGKAVLCEKPLGVNAKEVKEMQAYARQQNCFLMEAIWTRFHPNTLKCLEWIKSGEIGEPQYLRADFGFFTEYDPEWRLYNMDLAGGALLDIGIYPLFLAQLIFGKPQKIQSMAALAPTGADKWIDIQIAYPGDKLAHLNATVVADTNIEAEIYGSQKRIKIHNRWHNPSPISLYERETLLKHETFPNRLGYAYEIEEVIQCLDAGKKESDLLPHAFTLQLVETMDEIRQQCNIVYPKFD